MFKNQRCYHSFCSECVIKQVATKIQDKISIVSCPGLNCKGVLDLESCRSLLPKELIDKWNDSLCESLFITVPKFYCPFKDCSAMLLDENEGGGEEEYIRESECPFCHRLFCARCHVPWHPGIGCEEYQKLNVDERGREDLLVRELANQKKWRRCPKCKFYVEKNEGCLHITCRPIFNPKMVLEPRAPQSAGLSFVMLVEKNGVLLMVLSSITKIYSLVALATRITTIRLVIAFTNDIEECKVTMNLKSDMTDLSMLRDNAASEVLVDMQGDLARAGCFGCINLFYGEGPKEFDLMCYEVAVTCCYG
ncbi:putative E3 ubiquitin-protein ligase RNF144A-like protein [Trifolium pratense]|uniref:RBR-type E3 ubiquitin transferase n=1 Tax=Trifolium pratense TaxID=57577 RepID=A0A2K3NHI8_TRIPR|nr:putative E3 ubiquitin-protein ligase RNF144A-like protein [Trifolium pratense]